MIILQRKSKKGQRKSTNEKTVKTFIIFVAIIKIYAQLKSIAKKEGKKKTSAKVNVAYLVIREYILLTPDG